MGMLLSPPWIRRGWLRIKKISRSDLNSRRRARSASATARSITSGSFKPPIIDRLNEPPRPLPTRLLRDVFLRSRPPLLSQGGEYALLDSIPVVGQQPLTPVANIVSPLRRLSAERLCRLENVLFCGNSRIFERR